MSNAVSTDVPTNVIKKPEPTVCLCMIVKNESRIIARLLESVIPLIDTYCICDTGSTDSTVEIIDRYFTVRTMPGAIIYHDFVNFEVDRNIALRAAENMADYVLLIDADMELQIDPAFKKTSLTGSAYNLQQGSSVSYFNTRLLPTKIGAKYVGVTHEYIDIPDGACKTEQLTTLKIRDFGDGGCKDDKFKRDIELLLKGIVVEPQHAIRYNFYLANSYSDTGDYNNALKYYEAHAKIVVWNEEHFYNYYRQGLCYKHLNNPEKMSAAWVKAWSIRPTRVESLYELVHYHRCRSEWNQCKLYYEMARHIAYPKDDILFVHKDIYDHKLMYEYSVFAYYIGEKDIVHRSIAKLMSIPGAYQLDNLFHNYKFYYPLLKETRCVKIVDSFSRVINGATYNFRSSTPSIVPKTYKKDQKQDNNNDNKCRYAMNLRYVNYNITANGTYEWVKNIVTINKYIELTGDLDLETEIDNAKELETVVLDRQYEGIEDIKLMAYNGDIYFTGTSFKTNNQIGIVGGKYNCRDLFEFREFSKDNESGCEKNWVYLPDATRMIYKWSPLQIGHLVDHRLINIVERPMPNVFSWVRGSTNAFQYQDEIWFVVHLVYQHNGEPRTYYHMFVKFDLEMNLLAYSVPFKFSNQPIEYCCGLIVEQDRIIVTHSVWDRESYIKCYDKRYVATLYAF